MHNLSGPSWAGYPTEEAVNTGRDGALPTTGNTSFWFKPAAPLFEPKAYIHMYFTQNYVLCYRNYPYCNLIGILPLGFIFIFNTMKAPGLLKSSTDLDFIWNIHVRYLYCSLVLLCIY